MRSPEALTFNDEFDTQGHDNESFAVGHLSAPSYPKCPSSRTFLEIGQMINLGYPKTINPGGPFGPLYFGSGIFFHVFLQIIVVQLS